MTGRYGLAIGNVLHPTDFSHGSFVAFAHAMKLVHATRGKLTVLHVDPDKKSPDWNAYPSVRTILSDWGELPHDASRSDVGELGLQIRKAAIESDSTADGILEHLESHPADLIVMASHQRSGIDRWMHQEIAGRVATATDAAALFVPYGMRGFVDPATGSCSLNRILIPVDHAPHPEPAVEVAVDLVQALVNDVCHIRLLHVGDPAGQPSIRIPSSGKTEWHGVNRDGDVVGAILGEAEEFHADLIIMTTTGRHGFLDAI